MFEGNSVPGKEKRYMLVARTISFLFNRHDVLLIKGSMNRTRWAGLYNGVGGHVEQGESILDCAKRELLEEAGIEGVSLDLVCIITIDNGKNPGVCLFVYRGEYEGEAGFESGEGKIEWVDLGKVDSLPIVDDLQGLLGLAFTYKKGDRVKYLKYAYDADQNLTIVRSDN